MPTCALLRSKTSNGRNQLGKKFINVPNRYKYTNYIEIDVSDLNVVQGIDGVFVIPNEEPLDLINRIISFGKVGQ